MTAILREAAPPSAWQVRRWGRDLEPCVLASSDVVRDSASRVPGIPALTRSPVGLGNVSTPRVWTLPQQTGAGAVARRRKRRLCPRRSRPSCGDRWCLSRGRNGRGREGDPGSAADVLCLPSPDWLNRASRRLAQFQDAASGPGVIPWRQSVAELAEGWFNRLVTGPVHERTISVAGAQRALTQPHGLCRRLSIRVSARRAPCRGGGGAGRIALALIWISLSLKKPATQVVKGRFDHGEDDESGGGA